MSCARFCLLLAFGLAGLPSLASEAALPDKAADPSLLLWLPLDEGAGSLALDRSTNRLEGELTNIQWAKGAFGAAAYFGGTNAFIDLPPVPGLSGATQFTISVWATWEGTGRYPNLLSTHNWSPGGLLLFVGDNACSFRIGRPGERAGAPGNAWTETGVPLLQPLPRREWTHLGVVFAKPQLTSYVNGRRVAQEDWPYAVEAQGLRVGAWSGPVCHQGLIRDLRIYGRALAAPEVMELARQPAGAGASYTLADESKTPPPLAASFENARVTMAIDTRGRIASLRSRASGRELLLHPAELVSASLKDGRRITARSASFRDGQLTFAFARDLGEAVLAVETHPNHFSFTIRSLTVPEAASLTFFYLPVAPAKYFGHMANMVSDEMDAVCLRGYDLPVEMYVEHSPAGLRIWSTAERGLTGWRAGLAAGAKADMPAMLRAMAVDAGVPLSRLGGPWALGAEANRGSYLFADLASAAVDDWIELARRGGFTHLHFHGWWDTLGHYGVNTNLFPNGLSDMKAAVARIHAAGLKAGMHTLTACIEPRDSWVTPEASPYLIATAVYTLARPMSPNDTVIYVNEKPGPDHDVIFSYMGNGNAIRIGTEIVQYGEVVSKAPYAFAKCQRGAFKTRPTAHAVGERADYLQQRYIAFYPEPGSPLADQLADSIAKVFNACQFDQIYFDGSEGMMSRYGIDFMRHNIFKRLRGEVLVEASAHGAHNWWFHSRLGAWDHPVWAAKRFHDLHVASAAKYRDTDLLEPQMGWWAPRLPTPQARGHFLDEIEYFGAKNLACDSAMSIQGVNVSRHPLNFHVARQFTVLGWYEQLRRARYFDAQTLARLRVPGDEVRLRQDQEGAWKFTPVKILPQRISALGNGSERWTSRNPFPAQPLSARIEALYSVASYSDSNRTCVADFSDLAALRQTTSASSVSLGLREAEIDTRGDGHNLRMIAGNKGTASRGAWAKAGLAFPAPYRSFPGAGAMGLWVKGDGKGALLNIQLATPREYMHALSDHYVTLDFQGWRYVELLLRERDVERMSDCQWPYGGDYDLYRNPLDMAHVSEVNLYLNNLPAGEITEVIVSPIMALPVRPAVLKNPSLVVNGQRLVFPVALKSGDFLELEASAECAHYSDKGDLIEAVHPLQVAEWPALLSGENVLAFDCDKPEKSSARAEVGVTVSGTSFGTRNSRQSVGWQCLAREYEMPRCLPPAALGRSNWEVAVRPEETARLEIELSGGMEMPVLTVNGVPLRFPVTLKDGHKLFCRSQRHWVVMGDHGARIAEGDLPDAPPLLRGGSNPISFSCGNPIRPTITLVKVYQP